MNDVYFEAAGVSSRQVGAGCSSALSKTLDYAKEHMNIRVSAKQLSRRLLPLAGTLSALESALKKNGSHVADMRVSRRLETAATTWECSFNIYVPDNAAANLNADLDDTIEDTTSFASNLLAALKEDAENVTLLESTFVMGQFGESPPDSPVTAYIAEIEREETALVDQILSSGSTREEVTVDGVTLVAERIDTSSAAASDEPVVIGTEEEVSVAIPVQTLIQDLGIDADADLVVVVAPLNTARVSAGFGADTENDDQDNGRSDQSGASSDSSVQVTSSVSVNLFDENGAVYSVSGLADPILLTLPVRADLNDDEELICAFWDESIADWSEDGVSVVQSTNGNTDDGSITCATTHLTLFGAIIRGFTGAFVCSQAELLTSEGFRLLGKGKWVWHFSALVLWATIIFFAGLLFQALRLDYQRADLWTDGAFLIPDAKVIPKSGFEDGLVSNLSSAMSLFREARETWRKAAAKAIARDASGLGVLWASTTALAMLLARHALGRVAHHNACADIKVHQGDQYERLVEVLGLNKPVLGRGSKASGSSLSEQSDKGSFWSSQPDEEDNNDDNNDDNNNSPASKSKKELELEKDELDVVDPLRALGKETDAPVPKEPAVRTSLRMAGYGDRPPSEEPEVEPSEDHYRPQGGISGDLSKRSINDSEDEGGNDVSAANRRPSEEGSPASRRKSCLCSPRSSCDSPRSSPRTGSARMSPANSSKADHMKRGGSNASAKSKLSRKASYVSSHRPTPMSRKGTLGKLRMTLAPDRPDAQRELLIKHLRRLHKSHAARMEYHQMTFGDSSSYTWIPSMITRPLLTLGPIGACLVFSIFMRSSTRVLLLICHVAGAVAVTTFFLSQDGVPAATSSFECKNSPDLWTIMGRLVAISISSGLFAELPVAALSRLHRRRFKAISYEVGSKAWNRQLRRWFTFDILLWTCGLIYVAFCLLYIMLFIANVADEHHSSWLVSSGMEIVNHMFVVPLGVAILPTALAAFVVKVVSAKYGVKRDRAVHIIMRDEEPDTDKPEGRRISNGSVHVVLNVDQPKMDIDGLKFSEELALDSGKQRRDSLDSCSSDDSIKSNLTWI